jgi:hypothetical protein
MTGTSAAAIRTLTAEVRVLMVGPRQITLAAFGQLDYAEPGQLELFGRVNPGPDEAQLGYMYLIGRHRETGALARCRVPATETAIQGHLLWEFRHQATNHSGAATETGHERQAGLLREQAAQLARLPLIVLAGLR